MKEKLKKFDLFMLQHGGYALLVATIATVFFFAVLQWANDYIAEETKELKIQIDKDGYLYVDYQYDDKENVYILWETDGGNLKAENKTEEFKNQESSGYYCYSLSDERVLWNPADADGYNYNTATVRAVLYEKQKDNIYKIENYVLETTITLTIDNSNVKKAEDRYFSNPIREGEDTHWSQIYCVEESDNIATYRYRTGEETKEEYVLCWESSEEVLCETAYGEGYLPECKINEDLKNQEMLRGVTLVSCIKEKSSGAKIEAYLIHKDDYYKEKLADEKKMYNIGLEIK